MEAVIFCGIQATGKSTFYKARFFATHVRISMDLLNTRNREAIFLDACLNSFQKFVVDNTNVSREDRLKYISLARKHKYKVIGYYFQSGIAEAISRNNERTGKACIPEVGIRGAYNRLQLPSPEEGFDELYYVSLQDGGFIIKEWNNEV